MRGHGVKAVLREGRGVCLCVRVSVCLSIHVPMEVGITHKCESQRSALGVVPETPPTL